MANISSINGNPIVVGTSGIEDGAVTGSKIADGAVTEDKLAGSVTAASSTSEAISGVHPYNEMGIYYGEFGKYTIGADATVGSDVEDDSTWSASNYRISSHKAIIQFDHDCVMRLGDNIGIKVVRLTNGKLAEALPARWTTAPGTITLESGQQYAFIAKRMDDGAIQSDDIFGIYIDSLEQYVDDRTAFVMEYGDNPINLFHSMYGTFRNIVPKAVGESIIDDSNWMNSSIRLSSRIIFSPSINCSIRCGDGYKFKVGVVEDNILVSWSSPWYMEYNLTAGTQYVFGLSHTRTSDYIYIGEETTLKIDALDQAIEKAGTSGTVVKPYYKNEIEDTIAKVRAANTEPALVLFWCSDLHHMSVQGTRVKDDTVTDMTANMRAIAERLRIDGLLCLGDVVDAKDPTPTSETREEIDYVMQRLHWVGVPIIYAMGNHDDNRYVESGTERFSMGECYSRMVSYSLPERVSDSNYSGLNYYVDYPQHKVRIIVADANYLNQSTDNWSYGYSDEARAWIAARLADTPEGYGVILAAHMSPIKEHNYGFYNYQNFDNIKSDIQAFIDGGGNYICTLYGHTHVDYSATSPWLEIAIGAEKAQNVTIDSNYPAGSVAPQRTELTATEDLWDVLIVKPNSNTIDCIRFGAGSDRSFTY